MILYAITSFLVAVQPLAIHNRPGCITEVMVNGVLEYWNLPRNSDQNLEMTKIYGCIANPEPKDSTVGDLYDGYTDNLETHLYKERDTSQDLCGSTEGCCGDHWI